MKPVSPTLLPQDGQSFPDYVYPIEAAKDQQDTYNVLPGIRLFTTQGPFLSRWQLTPDELKAIQETGCIYLEMLTFGGGITPVILSVTPPVIEEHQFKF